MGAGQVISDTFGIAKARFGPLLGLWAIYFALTTFAFIAMAVVVGAVGMAGSVALGEGDALSAEGAMAGGAAMMLVLIVFYLGYLIVAMAQYASLITMASPLRRSNVGEALGAGWRSAPTLLSLVIILLVGLIAAGLVLGPIEEVFDASSAYGSLLFAVLLSPVVIWLGCRLCPLSAVVAVDRVRNPFAAIARSWRLTRGHALTIFLASLVFTVILLLICGVALLPSIGLLRSMADPAAMIGADAVGPALGGMALLFLGFLVASVLVNVLYCAFMAVIHGRLTSAAEEGTAATFA